MVATFHWLNRNSGLDVFEDCTKTNVRGDVMAVEQIADKIDYVVLHASLGLERDPS
jgi:hypothetical protein